MRLPELVRFLGLETENQIEAFWTEYWEILWFLIKVGVLWNWNMMKMMGFTARHPPSPFQCKYPTRWMDHFLLGKLAYVPFSNSQWHILTKTKLKYLPYLTVYLAGTNRVLLGYNQILPHFTLNTREIWVPSGLREGHKGNWTKQGVHNVQSEKTKNGLFLQNGHKSQALQLGVQSTHFQEKNKVFFVFFPLVVILFLEKKKSQMNGFIRVDGKHEI